MDRHSVVKPGTPSPLIPSKSIIITWLKSLFPELPLTSKIEDFGDGVIYCRILNHFHGSPPHIKITWTPKNEYQYLNNLKHAQTALLQFNIPISFDVNRVSKRKFLENWVLINSFYKHFTGQEPLNHQQHSNSSYGTYFHHTHHTPSIHYGNTQKTHPSQTSANSNQTARPNHKRIHPGYNNQLDITTVEKSLHPSYGYEASNSQKLALDHNIPINVANILIDNHTPLKFQFLKQNLNTYNFSNNIMSNFNSQNTPTKGKWSVGSQMFQNNYHIVIDRVKEILFKGSHDTEKIRQIKMLLGIPIEEQIIKIQDDDLNSYVFYKDTQSKQSEIKLQQKVQPKRQQQDEIKDIKQVLQIAHRQQHTNHSFRQAKPSVSKSNKKPFKI